jgi:predicted RNA-binding protein with PIN domain
MIYLIDANNLAGKMGLLGEDEFDVKLVRIIENWLGDKGNKVVLVFDSLDPMGDKRVSGNLTVVYAPRDEDAYPNAADDKIVELLERMAGEKDEITVVTDDSGLTDRSRVFSDSSRKIMIESSAHFAPKILRPRDRSKLGNTEGARGLREDQIHDINDELMRRWSEDPEIGDMDSPER